MSSNGCKGMILGAPTSDPDAPPTQMKGFSWWIHDAELPAWPAGIKDLRTGAGTSEAQRLQGVSQKWSVANKFDADVEWYAFKLATFLKYHLCYIIISCQIIVYLLQSKGHFHPHAHLHLISFNNLVCMNVCCNNVNWHACTDSIWIAGVYFYTRDAYLAWYVCTESVQATFNRHLIRLRLEPAKVQPFSFFICYSLCTKPC